METTPPVIRLDYAKRDENEPGTTSPRQKAINLGGLAINMAAASVVLIAAVHLPIDLSHGGRKEAVLVDLYLFSLLLPISFVGGCIAASNLTYARIGRAVFVVALVAWVLDFFFLSGYLPGLRP